MPEVKLYKRAANGEPQEWWIRISNGNNPTIGIGYGKVGGITHTNVITPTMTSAQKEYESRIAAKKKEGYKEISELYDNAPKDLSGYSTLYNYLVTHLPKYNVSSNGQILPMLAKTLEDNKIFVKNGIYRGQWKINGLRCLVGAEKVEDMFQPIHLIFQSREGTLWNLPYLEAKLLDILPSEMLDLMIDEGAYLDGEIYLPGYQVNDINHFVKNNTAPQHRKLQYWLYDVAVESMPYHDRRMILEENFENHIPKFNSLDDHLNNKDTLVFLPEMLVGDYNSAVAVRDNFIDLGFEGLIIRNPNSEYGFGKRSVGLMHKFKKIEDGLFTIVDIIPEGSKRSNLCKLVLRNDVNESSFECTVNTTQKKQEEILNNREEYIGHLARIQYRERSGVTKVPFHAKCVSIQ